MNNKHFNYLIIVLISVLIFRSCFNNEDKFEEIKSYSIEEIDSLKELVEKSEIKIDSITKLKQKIKVKIIEVSLINDSTEYDLQEAIYKKDTTEIIRKQSILISGLKTERDFYKELSIYTDSVLMLQNEDKDNLKQSVMKLEKSLQESKKDNKKLIDKVKRRSNIIKGSIITNLALITILILKK